MDNRKLIDMLRSVASCEFDYDESLYSIAADALERAEAELEKYRSAPTVAYVNMAITGIELSLIGRSGWLPLIIRPESP